MNSLRILCMLSLLALPGSALASPPGGNPEGIEANVFLGVRFGSYPGVAVGSAAALINLYAEGLRD